LINFLIIVETTIRLVTWWYFNWKFSMCK
jgi:hypothetical protein